MKKWVLKTFGRIDSNINRWVESNIYPWIEIWLVMVMARGMLIVYIIGALDPGMNAGASRALGDYNCGGIGNNCSS